ncbi:MAG TPA: HAD-IIA family hydrolase [Steroidobacteraceae bacterium]|nr:HAD-IIA family hydrolase [Steroidobacteraceae bacterium]
MRSARAFLFDLDGTLVLGDRNNESIRPLPGALALLENLRHRQVPYAIFTNGTVRTPQEYVNELHGAGIQVEERLTLTPSSVAAEHFVQRGYRRVRVLGVEGVWRPLEEAGLEIVRGSVHEPVDAVFVGWYREFTMDEIDAACSAVVAGAPLFTGSLAPYFASALGKVLASSRVICSAITSVTGKRATVLGKPSMQAVRCACRRLGARASDLVVVGDDPALEVFMARRAGAMGIAVRTGVWGQGDIARLPAAHRPHLVFQDVSELLSILDAPTSKQA